MVISYTKFKVQVPAEKVVTITSTGDSITGGTRKPVSDVSDSNNKATHFATQRPAFADSDLEPLLEQQNVQINAKPESTPTPLWQMLLFGFGPALLLVVIVWLSRRAGRFDWRVIVQPPDRAGRLAILLIHTRQIVLDGDVSLEGLAAQTVGLVGADLRNLANEAALLARAAANQPWRPGTSRTRWRDRARRRAAHCAQRRGLRARRLTRVGARSAGAPAGRGRPGPQGQHRAFFTRRSHRPPTLVGW